MRKVWCYGKTFYSDPNTSGGVKSIAIDRDHKIIACGNNDGTINLWNFNNGKEIKRSFNHPKAIRSLIFTQKGDKIISGCNDGVIRAWHLNSNQELFTLKSHSKAVTAIAIIPLNDLIGSSSEGFRG
jgi:WD40 repeat protein